MKRIFGFSSSAPPVYPTSKEEIRKEKEQESFENKRSSNTKLPSQEEVLSAFSQFSLPLSVQQFAHRLVPAYLGNSPLIGMNVAQCASYWIAMIDFWLKNEKIFIFSNPICKDHLSALKDQLEAYQSALIRYFYPENRNLKLNYIREAEKTIHAILKGVESEKIFYTPLGYCSGINNSGHAIPLKCVDKGDSIDLILLNRGEGLELHPLTGWDETGPKYHYQAFPVRVKKSVISSKIGTDLFSRLICLMVEQPDPTVRSYSAEDIYGAVRSIGEVRGCFPDDISKHTRKAQLGDICADVALEMVNEDCLIDFGYSKENIKRFFYLEKMFAILFFFQNLKKSEDRDADNWILLKNSLQEIAIKGRNLNSSVVSEEEKQLCHALVKTIATETNQKINEFRKSRLVNLFSKPVETSLFFSSVETSEFKNRNESSIKKRLSDPLIEEFLIFDQFQPSNPTQTFQNWAEKAKTLVENKDGLRAQNSLYRSMLSLEVPTFGQHDVWDTIPESQLSVTVLSLYNCLYWGLGQKDRTIYQRLFILTIGYAIADKLVRRKYPHYMNGYGASPFSSFQYEYADKTFFDYLLSRHQKNQKKTYYDLQILPEKCANNHWKRLCSYFENLEKHSTHYLFALDLPEVHLGNACKELQHQDDLATRPAADHLLFLEQFLHLFPKGDSRSIEEKMSLLWTDISGQYLPVDLHCLEALAFHTWSICRGCAYVFEQLPNMRKIVYEAGEPYLKLLASYLFSDNQTRTVRFGVDQFFNLTEKMRNGKKLTENATQCLKEIKDDTRISKKTFREWNRIFSTPELQIFSLVQWMERNISMLNLPYIQEAVQLALFEPGFLTDSIENEPSLIEKIRSILEAGLQEFGVGEAEDATILFLLQLGIILEAYAVSASENHLLRYEKTLLKMVSHKNSSSIYHTLLLLYQRFLPSGADSLRELIQAAFWLTLHPSTQSTPRLWIQFEGSFPLDQHVTFFEKMKGDKEWIESVFSKVFLSLFPEQSLPTERAIADGLKIVKGRYVFNLSNFSIYREGQKLLHFPMSFGSFSPHLTEHRYLWKEGQAFYSHDGLYKIINSPEEDLIVYQKFPSLKPFGFDGFLKKSKKLEFMDTPFMREEFFESWADETGCVMCSPDAARPYAVGIKNQNNEYEIRLVLPEMQLGPILANFDDQNGSLFSWLKRLGVKKDEVCVWIDPATKRVMRLDFVSFTLSFQGELIEEEWKLRSTKFPDYFLAEEQQIEELNYFSGALVLESKDRKAIILPARELAKDDQNFSTQVTLSTKLLDYLKRYFIFEIDPISSCLVSRDEEGQLYLSLLYAMQRNYAKAFQALKLARSFTYYEEGNRLFRCFYHLKDTSPEALAFYLRVAIQMIENAQQMILDGYGDKKEEKGKLSSLFYDWVEDHLDKYIRISSLNKINRVPAEMRLRKEEELFILNHIKNFLNENDRVVLKALLNENSVLYPIAQKFPWMVLSQIHWKEVFEMRKTLLEQGEWSTRILPRIYPLFGSETIDQMMFKIDKHLRAFPFFKSLDQEKINFVRVTEDELRSNFVNFYNKARSQENDLDLFYIGRSSDTGKDISLFQVYASLLQYVKKYPKEFEGLDFGDDLDKNHETFKKIVQIADRKTARFFSVADSIKKLISLESVFFQFHKNISLSHPTHLKEELQWKMSKRREDQFKEKRSAIYDRFIQKFLQVKKIGLLDSSTPFLFQSLEKKPLSYSQKTLIDQVKRGYLDLLNPKLGKLSFSLQDRVSIELCLEECRKLLVQTKKEIDCIKADVEQRVENALKDQSMLDLQKIGRNLPEITLEGVLTRAYEAQDPALIKEANPALQTKDIYELMSHVISYHLLRIQVFQLSNAINFLESEGDIQKAGEALASYGDFNPVCQPEIFLYQSRTGKILWQRQAELLEWNLLSGSEKLPPFRLFAAPAGDGKTTLYIPLEMKRMQRLGYTPVSVSSKSLYTVDREGLKQSAQYVYDMDLAVCELKLSKATVSHDFEWLYNQMIQTQGKKGIKLIPETYYALFLKFQLALENEEIESVRWLSKILFEFFLQKCAALIDECRLNCSPFTQAKIGIGKPVPLPKVDREVFIDLYRALTSDKIKLSDGRTLSEASRIEQNLQATVSKKEREEIQKTLLLHQSQWLRSFKTKEQKNRADDLIEVYLEYFFKTAMQLVGKMQHVRSIKTDEEVHVPARTKQATSAYFEEVYFTLIATIQGHLQEGLDFNQASQLFQVLCDQHFLEVGQEGRTSSIEENLKRWVGNQTIGLHQFTPNRRKSMKEFHQLIHKNKEAIFWYLEHKVLKQVVYAPEQISVNAMHFLHAFKSATLFSADPGPSEIYGIYQQQKGVKEDSCFVAHAVHKFIDPKNETFLTLPSVDSPKEFFKSLIKLDAKIFTDVRMICDAGGMLRDFNENEIVADFFACCEEDLSFDFDGIILFADASKTETETSLLLWLKEVTYPISLNGHDVPSAIRSLGLDWNRMRFLTYIDPSHRAGANIQQPKGSSVLVLLGESLTLSDTIQGALRGRGVLKDEQRVIWCASEKLRNRIAKDASGRFTSKQSMEWSLKNEGKTIDKEVLLSAYQQIDYLIAEPVFKLFKEYREKPQKQIALWKEYRQGFVSQINVDPVIRFKQKRILRPSSEILWEYAKEKYALFGFKAPWEKAQTLHQSLAPIILSVSKRMNQLHSALDADPSSQTYIHSFQIEEMKQEQQVIDYTDLNPCEKELLPDSLSFDHRNFLESLKKFSTPIQEIFESSHLTHNLFLTHNAIKTAKSGKIDLSASYLKPIQYILIVKIESQVYAFALADSDAVFFQKKLCDMTGKICQAALIGLNGMVIQQAKGRGALENHDLNTTFIQDVLIDMGLMRCQLVYPQRFLERIEKWHDFWPMWTKLKQAQPIPTEVYPGAIEKLVPQHLKTEASNKKEGKHFFSSWF